MPDYKRAIKKLPVVPDNHGIKLKALLDCEDENGKHQAGEEWQLNGPRTYIPRPEVVCERNSNFVSFMWQTL